MSTRQLLCLALLIVGSNWWFSRQQAQVVVEPVLVVPIEVPVPTVDHDTCVELLAAEVAQPATGCYSCHPGDQVPTAQNLLYYYNLETAPLDGMLIDGWLEIPAPNGADDDTGGMQFLWIDEVPAN